MIINVPINRIVQNPWQTRVGEPDAERIKELAMDIAQNGLLQAPVGRLRNADNSEVYIDWPVNEARLLDLVELGNRSLQLAFGHNRLAAFRWLFELRDNSNIPGDWSLMPVDIRTLTDEQMAIMSWSENEKRKDVSPIERAMAIQKRMADFGWNQHEVADQLGVARPTISNMLRLLKLPQKFQDALNDGTISARVGSALLPMYELPEETLKLAEGGWNIRPSGIERDALAGASSDLVRKSVEQLYRAYTKPLQGAEFGLDELYPEGELVLGYDHDASGAVTVYCGVCRTCDRRLKDQGNVCLDPNCYTAKQTLHRRAYLEKAAEACGIAAVDPNKGGSVTQLPYREDETQKIVGMKCENLRLVYTESKDNHRSVPGNPHALIVCDKRNGACTCIKGLSIAARTPVAAIQANKEEEAEYEGEIEDELEDTEEDIEKGEQYARQQAEVRAQTPAQDPKQLEELARQARKAKLEVGRRSGEVREKVVERLLEGVKYHEPGVLYLIAKDYPYPNAGDLADVEKLMAKIASNLANMIMMSNPESLDELLEIVNRKFEHLQLGMVSLEKTLVEVFQESEA